VYTAQGFEFDYVGIIFGLDLRYDWDTNQWIRAKWIFCVVLAALQSLRHGRRRRADEGVSWRAEAN
jgi:DUF2075 family protein